MLKLSIIIPVYNLENYIAETLDSCLNQDVALEEYEIICVNDGSKDKSAEIIEEYCQKYRNIRLYTQENAGVSTARNKGMDLARGKYIWFVDGDDLIAENCLGGVLRILETEDLDIFGFASKHVFERITGNGKIDTYKVGAEGEDYVAFLTAKGGIGGGVWGQIYKTAVIKENQLQFNTEIKYSEDVLFSFLVMMKAKRCAKTEGILYYYYQRQGSAMHSHNYDKHIQSMYLLAIEYQKVEEEGNRWQELARTKKYFAIKAMLFSMLQKGDVKFAKQTIKQLKAEKLYPFPLLWCSLRNNVTRKQKIFNYVSFLFSWKWYFMMLVRIMALKNRIKKKK